MLAGEKRPASSTPADFDDINRTFPGGPDDLLALGVVELLGALANDGRFIADAEDLRAGVFAEPADDAALNDPHMSDGLGGCGCVGHIAVIIARPRGVVDKAGL